MSTLYWGPDFDALAAFDEDIAGVVAGVRELIAAHPAYPAPARTA
jgi:hypothetical protein